MRPAVRNIILNAPAPIIPASVRPSVLAWWDGAKRGSVWAGLTNLVSNGNFANGTTGWAENGSTISTANNKLTITGSGASAAISASQANMFAYANGNKIYLKCTFKVTDAVCSQIYATITATGMATQTVTFQAPPQQNTVYTKSVIATLAPGGSGNVSVLIRALYADSATASGKVMEVQNVMAFELTAIFGAGNEPSAAEMDAILASEPAYWDGTRTVLANPASKYYWQDFSGNNRHLKLNNFAYLAGSGWNGDALVTDGVDDYGIRQDAWNPSGGSFTSAYVFNVPNVSGLKYLFATTYTTNAVIYCYVNDSKLTATAYDSASGNGVTTYEIGRAHV